MKIGQKLILGFIAIALLVGLVGSFAIKYDTQILFDVDQILLSNSKELKAASEISYYIQRVNSKIRELLLDTSAQNLEAKKQAGIAIEKSIYKLEQFSLIWKDAAKLGIQLSEREEKRVKATKAFEKLKTKVDSFIPLINKTIVLQEKKGNEAALLFFRSDVEPLLHKAQIVAKDLEKKTRDEIISQTKDIRKSAWNKAVVSVIATAIGLLAVIIVRFLINKTISNPIVKLKDAITKIGKGEFETKIETTSNDEIGSLAKSFNDMVPKLKASHTRLEETVQERTAKLEEEISHRQSAQRSLQQRVKQLDCFYGLSRLVEPPQTSLEQILQGTTDLIRNAYQQPHKICVRITFDGIPYKTKNFAKSEQSQYATIKVRGEKAGKIETYYLDEKSETGQSPFIKDERDMLDAVAERLGRVAELKQAGERLHLFRNLIDRSNDCIFVIEPKWGRFLDVNERACDSLGYTREEFLDLTVKNIDEFIPDDLSWQDRVRELKVESDIIEEGRYRRKDATTFFVEISLKYVVQKEKNYIIAVARDISERKMAEEKQAELIQELRDFAYIVSHDLKAPLCGIKTLADWLSADCSDKLDDNGREQIKLLMAQVERMYNLIEGVLQYSRVGRTREQDVHVNLDTLVPDVIDMVAPPDNINVTIENPLPVVKCEETRIRQVFENLLSNAVKYMDKQEGKIEIGCVEENGFWKFSVADNGPGIEEKHFERIFQMFQTLSPKDEFQSTGIGLTVIKKIVELYEGKIWIESKLGSGSSFFFTLPRLKEEVKVTELAANNAYQG
ncbi:MAG: ATP-binding protein [Planctomycetota bacterium]|jgi:PAS domain S-box-containing protein